MQAAFRIKNNMENYANFKRIAQAFKCDKER